MEKILTQDEIDALFRATQKGQIPSGEKRVAQKNVSKFNLREISQINKDQVRALYTEEVRMTLLAQHRRAAKIEVFIP